MAGFPVLQACGGAAVAGNGATLPRRLHRALLALLRPAEAAARRLVIVAARGLVVELRPGGRKPSGAGLLTPAGATPPPLTPPRKGEGELPRAGFPSPASGGGFGMQMHRDDGSSPVDGGGVAAGDGGGIVEPKARVPSLALFDPLPRFGRPVWHAAIPRISVPGFTAPFPIAARRPPSPYDPIDAARLARRLKAMAAVLDDLPRHAKRFARWQARKAALLAAPVGDAGVSRRFRRLGPLRPGRPPGHRPKRSRRRDHAVDAVLADVHGLAVWALADTS